MSIFPSLFGRKTNKPAAASQDPMSLDIWDACEGFSIATTTLALPAASAAVSMDWKETADHHVFLADFPGVKKEEVSIEVEEEKVLKISAQRAKVSEEKGDKWHRLERNHDKFFRSIRLPQDANTEEMKAKLENGVLVVTVPKKQDKKAQTRLVQIAG